MSGIARSMPPCRKVCELPDHTLAPVPCGPGCIGTSALPPPWPLPPWPRTCQVSRSFTVAAWPSGTCAPATLMPRVKAAASVALVGELSDRSSPTTAGTGNGCRAAEESSPPHVFMAAAVPAMPPIAAPRRNGSTPRARRMRCRMVMLLLLDGHMVAALADRRADDPAELVEQRLVFACLQRALHRADPVDRAAGRVARLGAEDQQASLQWRP